MDEGEEVLVRSFDSRTRVWELWGAVDGDVLAASKRSSFLGMKGRPKPAFAFVGVTNRPDLIDPAILRRFARVIALGLPELEERASILGKLMQGVGAHEGLDLHVTAERTEGWTRGDLRACVDDVARMAAGRSPSAADLDAALAARECVRGMVQSRPA